MSEHFAPETERTTTESTNHWHYDVMEHDGVLAVHEIYLLDGEKSWTENPVTFVGDTREEVAAALRDAANDVELMGSAAGDRHAERKRP